MFTKLTVLQRFQVGLILAMAFLLVLSSNRLDRRHFTTVQNTVNSVHDDRVVVQDFIYRLNTLFHQKELFLVQNRTNFDLGYQNAQIDELLASFRATKLTNKESRLLNGLQQEYDELRGLENRNFNAVEDDTTTIGSHAETIIERRAASSKKMQRTLDEIKKSLAGLSEIQLTESIQLTQLSNKSLGINILLSNLELAFLIIIGIALLVLIFVPSSKRMLRPFENR